MHWGFPLLRELLPESNFAKIRQAYGNPFYPYTLPVETVPFYHGVTGEILFKVPCPNLKRLSRRRTRQVCAEGLDIQWNKKLVDISQDTDRNKVTTTFQDGQKLEVDLVIGADGSASTVRDKFFGVDVARVVLCDIITSAVNVSFDDAEKATFVRSGDPVTAVTFGPRGMIIINSKCLISCLSLGGRKEKRNPDVS